MKFSNSEQYLLALHEMTQLRFCFNKINNDFVLTNVQLRFCFNKYQILFLDIVIWFKNIPNLHYSKKGNYRHLIFTIVHKLLILAIYVPREKYINQSKIQISL